MAFNKPLYYLHLLNVVGWRVQCGFNRIQVENFLCTLGRIDCEIATVDVRLSSRIVRTRDNACLLARRCVRAHAGCRQVWCRIFAYVFFFFYLISKIHGHGLKSYLEDKYSR